MPDSRSLPPDPSAARAESGAGAEDGAGAENGAGAILRAALQAPAAGRRWRGGAKNGSGTVLGSGTVFGSGTTLGLLVLAAVGGVYLAVAGLPLFSESFTQLALAATHSGPLAALDPPRVPFRPLQNLAFYVLHAGFDGSPAWGRALSFGLEALCALLVLDLARRLGASRGAAWTALLLFLAYPSAKGLTWIAALGGPGRTLGMLLVLWGTVAFAERRSRAAGWILCGAFALALGFHQSALVAPALVLGGLWFLARGAARERAAAVARALGRPEFVAFLALAVGYWVYLEFVRQDRYHGVAPLGSIVANGARASLALAPGWLRLPALEGLRGPGGSAGLAAGLVAVAGAWALFGACWARARGPARWLLLVVPLDLVLPVLSTGFVGRYAHFAAAAACIAVGLMLDAARGRGTRPVGAAAVVLLGLSWAVDHARDVVELRRAGRLVEDVLADAAAARSSVPPGRVIALIDVPDHAGRENDIPVFNWGLAQALARRGVRGPWNLLRVRPCWTTSDHRALDEQELAELARQPDFLAWRFDPARGRLARWP